MARHADTPAPSSGISWWYDRLEPRPAPRATLPADRSVDVCIVGAGFTGLWAAYELLRADPGLGVIVLEARVAGFGASGRNGGWVIGELADARGDLGLLRAAHASVGEVEAVVERERIACDLHRGGALYVAQSELQLARLRERATSDRSSGLDAADGELLDAGAVRARVCVREASGGYAIPHAARVQPAKLVTGLAAAAERLGAVIHERTAVTRIEPGRVATTRGSVRAPLIVRATEAYTRSLPGLRRALLPLNSSMIVTEVLDDATWAQIGWDRAETIGDGANLYVYLQRTADGRIAIGGRGVPYRLGSRTDREGPVPAATVAALRTRLAELLPGLDGVRVDCAWHGVLGVPRDWRPRVAFDRARGIAWAGGYVGEGVAAANLAGRTLRDLLLGHDTELTRMPWVGGRSRDWEPEPLRYAGARSVYALLGAADRSERRRGRPSAAARAADRIAGR